MTTIAKDLENSLDESERVILFSAIEGNGVFKRKCEIKFIKKNGAILFDGESLYPLGKIGDCASIKHVANSSVIGKFENVLKVTDSQKTKKWILMEKSFAVLESPIDFVESFIPEGISVNVVRSLEQLFLFNSFKCQFLKEESGGSIDVDESYEALKPFYKSVFPVLMTYKGEEIGIVNSDFCSKTSSMVNMLFIKKEFRSLGFGEFLLKWYVNELLKKSKNVCLFYSPGNIQARELYKKVGFVQIDKWLMAVEPSN